MNQKGLVVASVGLAFAIVSIAGDAQVSYAPLSCAASVLLVGAIVSTAEDAEVSCDKMDGVADEVSVIAGGDFTGGSMNSEHRELRVALRVTAANAESRRVKPGLYFVRRSTQTILRKRVYADTRVMGVYTPA